MFKDTNPHPPACRLPSRLCRICWDMIGWAKRGLWDWDYNPQISIALVSVCASLSSVGIICGLIIEINVHVFKTSIVWLHPTLVKRPSEILRSLIVPWGGEYRSTKDAHWKHFHLIDFYFSLFVSLKVLHLLADFWNHSLFSRRGRTLILYGSAASGFHNLAHAGEKSIFPAAVGLFYSSLIGVETNLLCI